MCGKSIPCFFFFNFIHILLSTGVALIAFQGTRNDKISVFISWECGSFRQLFSLLFLIFYLFLNDYTDLLI